MERRMAILALALSVYHAAEGRYPSALSDLAPRYLDAVPTDMFAGLPLRYTPNDAGYILYSIGPNRSDDGGESSRPYSGDGADDIVIRVGEPAAAGEPAATAPAPER